MAASRWESPYPGQVIDVVTAAQWAALGRRYPNGDGKTDPVLRECLSVARRCGACSVVIETRYIDPDYRSELSNFYASTFAHVEASAVRLHFFKLPLADRELSELPREEEEQYVGYVTVRPLPFARVGRTMLPPPDDIRAAVRTMVDDEATLFGKTYTVTGVPFMAQDGQLARCAHVDAWICHFSAHCRDGLGRATIADISLGVDPALSLQRDLPSAGLNRHQLLDLLRNFDLAPAYYPAGAFPSAAKTIPGAPKWLPPDPVPPADDPDLEPGFWDWRFIPISCRYLNSGLPVIVGTDAHTFVLCGFRRIPQTRGPDWIELVRHDDQVGPYQVVNDIFKDRYAPWELIVAPMPRKLFLLPEAAEWTAAILLERWAEDLAATSPGAGGERVLDLMSQRRLALRTYAISANQFKRELLGRGVPAKLAAAYRLARMPRLLWVVEAVDRDLRRRSEECVVGEVVLDPTSPEHHAEDIAIHLLGMASISRTDGKPEILRCPAQPYRTGGAGPA